MIKNNSQGPRVLVQGSFKLFCVEIILFRTQFFVFVSLGFFNRGQFLS